MAFMRQQVGGEARAFAVQADVSRREDLRRAFNQAVEGLGGLDILLNNVGITRWSKAEEMSETDWDIVLENLILSFL
jgi:2-deoxy-D-gluconate 3-dehydrogenase